MKMRGEKIRDILVDFGSGFGDRVFALLTAEIVDPLPVACLLAGSRCGELPREPA
jgi:hypothetical protein